MKVEVEGMLAVNELLRKDESAQKAYFELLDVLQECRPPRRDKPKSKPGYVFDQSGLIESARGRLATLGWAREELIHDSVSAAGSALAPVKADMSKGRLHAIFEFGNRASYAYNTLSRFALGTDRPGYVATAFVVPTTVFANRIDSNLATYERLVAEFKRLERVLPRMIPGPLLIIGLEPDDEDLTNGVADHSTTRDGPSGATGRDRSATSDRVSKASRSRGPSCLACAKQFKTPGGLKWHLENSAKCRR